MFDLHIFSRFLRLLRSIRRSLLALFVAIAMLLATFVIAPAYALSAGESAGADTTSTEKVEGAKSGSTNTESDQKQQSGQNGSSNAEPTKGNNTDTSSNLKKNDNKVLKSDTKQQPDSNKAGNKADNNAGNNTKPADKAKSADKTRKTVEKSAANKKAKDSKNKGADSAKAVNGTDKSANEEPQLPEACKSDKRHNTFAKCYAVRYYNGDNVVDDSHPILVQRGSAIPIKPKFEIKSTKEPADTPGGLRFELEKYNKKSDPVPSWANFEKTEKNSVVKVQDTKGQMGFDGSITLRPNGKWDYGNYKFKIFAYHNNEKIYTTISVKVDVSDAQKDDLKLNLYDFGNADSTAKKDNDNESVSITIKPKPKGSAPAGSTAGSDDNKDTYDSINNKLFIESQSKDKIGFIYHHMICKTGSGDDASYTLDSVNGLNLSNKDGSTTEKQTRFKHKENKDRPKDGTAENFALYENDPYTEESQSWISGTPTKAGAFECKVFAVKDVELKRIVASGPKGAEYKSSTVSQEFNSRVEADKQSLFDNPEQNIVDTKWDNKASIKQGVDWDYKSVTIEVKSSEPPEPKPPEIGKNDLTLKVYPFKNSDGSLPSALSSSNNDIYAMLGTELKPYIDAISAADSVNKITLRVLCSKGEKKTEKKDSGSQSEQSSGSSQPAQPSESPQDSKDLEYKTWSSNLADLGLSVPADDNQNTCHSNKEGDKTCASADPSKKVAARTDKEVSIKPSIKPTAVGDYQCVVFALKPDALTKFDTLTGDATQSGSLTPDLIKSKLTSATPTAFTETKDFAAFTLNIHLSSNFTLPNTGGQSWNLQLGILAALLVNLLAAGFVVSQSEKASKLIFGRWRGLCNYV
ncbi:hypothetical protein [Gardnerella vaginalis]|uniref:hypothetical protein n=1 Tax=Gardnerella vaginalis TaxID=2702 RepID=UPI0039EDE81F